MKGTIEMTQNQFAILITWACGASAGLIMAIILLLEGQNCRSVPIVVIGLKTMMK